MNATYAQLCRYHYDPLDRLATCSPAEQQGIQRFYQKNRLTTEIQGQIQRAFFQTEDQLLAQHQGASQCTLLASDQQRSVLEGLDASQRQSASYTPYGVRHPQANPLELLGYTGERADPVTGHYLLGNGYRAYNPVLMRFNSPDSLSPFGEGGMNAYAYCGGDPVSRVDPTGHIWQIFKPALRALRLIRKSRPIPAPPRTPAPPAPPARLFSSVTRLVDPNEIKSFVRGWESRTPRISPKQSLFEKALINTPINQLINYSNAIKDKNLKIRIWNTAYETGTERLNSKLKSTNSITEKYRLITEHIIDFEKNHTPGHLPFRYFGYERPY